MRAIRRLLRRRPRTLTSDRAYALWANSYPPHAHNPLMQVEEAAMRDLLPPLAGQTVLDLAGGTGRYAAIATEAGARQIICLDASAAMLQHNPHRQRAQADLTALPLPTAAIDVIICGMALGHLPDIRPALTEMGRVLRPGGTVLISDFHPIPASTGAQRTFTAPDGRVYAVEHHIHRQAAYAAGARAAGLAIDTLQEPALHGSPVVIIYRMRREL